MVGIVTPILPTTPLVILAAFLFSKGSPRLHKWLSTHRIFGPLIQDWQDHGAIPARAKIMAVAMMALVFLGSILADLRPMLLIIQAVCLGGAALFILTRPSSPRS